MKRSPTTLRLVATAGLSLMLLACATKPMPTVQMALANNALDQAVASGASEHAPNELRSARDRQDRARLALQADDPVLALSLSQEAQVDAELAEARTHAAKARMASTAVRDGTRILKEEMGRKAP
jgi:phage shock protein A